MCRTITVAGAAEKAVGGTGARCHLLPTRNKETTMKSALIGAAAVAAAAFATPALAQAVISEPGYCAQFYPNANCQNLGPGNPYTDGGSLRNDWQNGSASMEPVWHRHHRRHHG
jgi:hypothetical protein